MSGVALVYGVVRYFSNASLASLAGLYQSARTLSCGIKMWANALGLRLRAVARTKQCIAQLVWGPGAWMG